MRREKDWKRSGMPLQDMALATIVAAIWGFAFVVSKWGLTDFSPGQLAFFRFCVAGIAVIWIPRPAVPWSNLLGIGLTLFTGQFLLQFLGLVTGMPAGLTAVVAQTQALFTVALAAVILEERPSRRQTLGMSLALGGILMIGMALDKSVPLIALLITLASALSWAIGNVQIKRLGSVNMLGLVIWASLVPPVPAIAFSLVFDSPGTWSRLYHTVNWINFLAPLYLGLAATVLAYVIWGRLLQRHSAAAVVPYALLAPCVGAIASSSLLGEHFNVGEVAGMALIIFGVVITVVKTSGKLGGNRDERVSGQHIESKANSD